MLSPTARSDLGFGQRAVVRDAWPSPHGAGIRMTSAALGSSHGCPLLRVSGRAADRPRAIGSAPRPPRAPRTVGPGPE